MKCSEVQLNLLDFSQDRLSPPETGSVKAHLEACSDCRALLESEVALAGRLARTPAVSPASDVWSKVESRIHSEPRRAFDPFVWFRIYPRRLAAAAAVFVILLAAVFVTGPWRTPHPSQQESIRQAATLMQVQPANQQSDEQLTGTTDDMMKVIESEL